MSDGANLYKKLPNLFCDSYLVVKHVEHKNQIP